MPDNKTFQKYGLKMLPIFTIVDPVKPPDQTYAKPVEQAAKDRFVVQYLIRPTKEQLVRAWNISEVMWIDWCVEEAVFASRLNRHRNKTLIIRVHAFEVLEGNFASDVEWQNVTALIAVSDEVLELLTEQVPDLADKTKTYVVTNGIDVDRFFPSPQFDAKQLAWVGVLAPKKNPFFALHLLHELHREDKTYQLHIAGEETNLRTVRHLRHLARSLKLEESVHLYGHVVEMPLWYQDKGVLVSTSLYESFGLAIGEAAAAGLLPVIFQFPNASAIWAKEFLVSTLQEAVIAVRSATQSKARDFVVARYPLSAQIDAFRDLLSSI